MTYTLKEIRDNIQLDRDNPSYCTFDVLTELDGESKWLSIPYDLYFEWASSDNENLSKYINKPEFFDYHKVIEDLLELGFDFKTSLLKYITSCYRASVFKKLPGYNPDNFFELGDDEDEDEIF